MNVTVLVKNAVVTTFEDHNPEDGSNYDVPNAVLADVIARYVVETYIDPVAGLKAIASMIAEAAVKL